MNHPSNFFCKAHFHLFASALCLISLTISGTVHALTGNGNFGSVEVGQSAQRTFTFTASQDLDFVTPSVSGADFNLVSHNCPSLLIASNFCTIDVSFTPTTEGSKNGIVEVSFDPCVASTPCPDSNQINLTGFGFLPPVTVTLATQDPDAAELNQDPGSCVITATNAYLPTPATLSKASVATTVFLNSAGGTATEGQDYNSLPSSVTIPAGQDSATLSITPMTDNEDEGSETVELSLESSGAYTIGSANSCIVTIADNPPPPAVNITSPSGDIEIFEGEFVDFAGDASSTSACIPDSYSWNFGAGASPSTSTAQNPGNIQFNQVGSYPATFTVNYTSTPEGESCNVGPLSDTVMVTVRPVPPPTIEITSPANDITILEGETVNFQSTITDNDFCTISSIAWDFDGGAPNSNQEDPGNVQFNQTGVFTVNLTVGFSSSSDYLLCPVASLSDSVTVNVVDEAQIPPSIEITSPPNGTSIFVGQSVDFQSTVDSTPFCEPSTFSWDFDGGAANSNQEDPGNIQFNTIGQFFVRLTVSFNSPDSETLCPVTSLSDSVTVSVTDVPPPSIEITSPTDDVTISLGGSVNFQSTISGNDYCQVSSIAWDFAGGAENSSAEDPGIVQFNQAGVFPVSLTVDFSSPNSAIPCPTPSLSDSVSIAVDPRDQISLSIEDEPREGEAITVAATRTSITRASDEPISIGYRTVSGTAIEGEDFIGVEGTFTWAANETGSREVQIQILSDEQILEEDETFGFELFDVPSDVQIEGDNPLTITISNTIQFPTKDLTENQRDLVDALNELCPTTQSTDLQQQCEELARLPDSERPGAYDQIIPDEIAAMPVSATTGVHFFMDLLQERTTALRAGKRGLDVDGLTLTAGDQSLPLGALGRSLTQDLSGGSAGNSVFNADFGQLGVFFSGRVAFGERDDTEREIGYDFDTLGLLAGADYRVSDQLVLGGALGYLNTDSDYNSNSGKLDTSGWTAALYGTYYFNNQWYLDGALQYGWNDYDSQRNITFGSNNTSAKGSTDGDQFSISLNAGADFFRNAWLFSPYLGLDYITASIDEFSESGGDGLALTVNTEDIDILTSKLGVRVSRNYSMSWGILSPTAFAEWAHEFKDDSREISSRFVVDPRVPFITLTDEPDRNYFNLGLGTSATFTEGRSGFINYRGRFGDSDFESHNIEAGIRFEF